MGNKPTIAKAKKVFWSKLAFELENGYSLDPVARIDKILDIMHICNSEHKSISLSEWHPDILVIDENCGPRHRLRFGAFAEVNIDNLDQISSYLRPNEQTITTLGVESDDLYYALLKSHFLHCRSYCAHWKSFRHWTSLGWEKNDGIFISKIEVK